MLVLVIAMTQLGFTVKVIMHDGGNLHSIERLFLTHCLFKQHLTHQRWLIDQVYKPSLQHYFSAVVFSDYSHYFNFKKKSLILFIPIMSPNVESSIRVAVRVRPMGLKEQHEEMVLIVEPNQGLVSAGNRKYNFDHACSPEMNQEDFYENCVMPLFKQFVKGYNATILAYGQTGSGKTYSMGTGQPSDYADKGVIPRFADSLFALVADISSAAQCKVSASFLELNGEKPRDLLNLGSEVRIDVRENKEGKICWVGMRELTVESPDKLLLMLNQGSKARSTAATDMNSTSSRSHAIFSVTLKQNVNEDNTVLISKFHFVDLAGSERLDRTNAVGERAKEGIAINTGLLALGNVISALSTGKIKHIPYRDSKLTRLLQDSLGGNSQTLMLACVSPAKINLNETITTLNYASKARDIKNRISVNEELTEVDRLKAQVQSLNDLLKSANAVEVKKLKDENERLKSELVHLKGQQGLLDGHKDQRMGTDPGTETLLGRYARMIESQRNEIMDLKAKPSSSIPRRPFLVSSSSRSRIVKGRYGKRLSNNGRHSRSNSGTKIPEQHDADSNIDLDTLRKVQAALHDEIDLLESGLDSDVSKNQFQPQFPEAFQNSVQTKKHLLDLLDNMEALASFKHASTELKRQTDRTVQCKREVTMELKVHEKLHSQLKSEIGQLEKRLNKTQDCLDQSDTRVTDLRKKLGKAIEEKKVLMKTAKQEVDRARQSSDNFKREIQQLKKLETGRKRLERELTLQKQSNKRVTEELVSHGTQMRNVASIINTVLKNKAFDSVLLNKAKGCATIRNLMVTQALSRYGAGKGSVTMNQQVQDKKLLLDHAISAYSDKEKTQYLLREIEAKKKRLVCEQNALLDERQLVLEDVNFAENDTEPQYMDERIEHITVLVNILNSNTNLIRSQAGKGKSSSKSNKKPDECLSGDPLSSYEGALSLVRGLNEKELLLMSEMLVKDLLQCKTENIAQLLFLNNTLETASNQLQKALTVIRQDISRDNNSFAQVVPHRLVHGLVVLPEETESSLLKMFAKRRPSVPVKKWTH